MNQYSLAHFSYNIADADEYAINTPGCVLPETSVWPDFFKNNWDWENNPVPDCRNNVKHVTLSADQKVKTIVMAMHE